MALACSRRSAAAALRAAARRAPRRAASTHARAAAVVVGNEILTGKVADANTVVLARELWECGVDLVRMETIPDDVDDIASTVTRMSELVGEGGFVFTSGGIGPTHDDVTYAGVAAAFGVGLELHEPTHRDMEAALALRKEQEEARGLVSAVQLNSPANRRMAVLPAGAECIRTPGLWVPITRLHNTYSLPGIPSYFEKMLGTMRPRLQGRGAPIYRLTIETSLPESALADVMAAAESELGVAVGSYPNVEWTPGAGLPWRTRVTFDSRSEADAQAAHDSVRAVVDRLEAKARQQ